jgi:IS30 family transposase
VFHFPGISKQRNLPRGSELSAEERTIISELNHAGFCVSDITKRLIRSKSAVSNSLRRTLSDNTSRRKRKTAKV